MAKSSTETMLRRQTKDTLIELVISLKEKFQAFAERVRETNLKLAHARVVIADKNKQIKSLRSTVKRRRKGARHA